MSYLDPGCVSHKFTTYLCLHLCQKWLLMRFILPVVFERSVRFLTAVDVVLKQHNNCVLNNKWLSVKYVLIVFDSIGALLMIRLTLISIVCSSSKRSQKKKNNKWLQKRVGDTPSTPPSKFASDEVEDSNFSS